MLNTLDELARQYSEYIFSIHDDEFLEDPPYFIADIYTAIIEKMVSYRIGYVKDLKGSRLLNAVVYDFFFDENYDIDDYFLLQISLAYRCKSILIMDDKLASTLSQNFLNTDIESLACYSVALFYEVTSNNTTLIDNCLKILRNEVKKEVIQLNNYHILQLLDVKTSLENTVSDHVLLPEEIECAATYDTKCHYVDLVLSSTIENFITKAFKNRIMNNSSSKVTSWNEQFANFFKANCPELTEEDFNKISKSNTKVSESNKILVKYNSYNSIISNYMNDNPLYADLYLDEPTSEDKDLTLLDSLEATRKEKSELEKLLENNQDIVNLLKENNSYIFYLLAGEFDLTKGDSTNNITLNISKLSELLDDKTKTTKLINSCLSLLDSYGVTIKNFTSEILNKHTNYFIKKDYLEFVEKIRKLYVLN